MSVAGLTLACRTALAAAITANGVTCRKYDVGDLGAGPIASLGMPTWELRDERDQSYGFKTVTFPVFVYQRLSNNATSAANYDALVESVVDAIGADRTLGGKVNASDVDGPADGSVFRQPNGQLYAVATVQVVVRPFPNTAS